MGKVTLAARAADGQVISVRDTGIGISEEDQTKIFEEFYQVGASRTQEGTGLGLALTRRLVELHHGELTVESEPGVGSTFTVTMPLNGRRSHTSCRARWRQRRSRCERPWPAAGLVLIVEDNERRT